MILMEQSGGEKNKDMTDEYFKEVFYELAETAVSRCVAGLTTSKITSSIIADYALQMAKQYKADEFFHELKEELV